MTNNSEIYDSYESVDERISIRNQVETYLKYWKWFALAALISLAYAYYQIRKTIPKYNVTSSILIKDDSQEGLTEIAAFADLGVVRGNKSGVEDEIEILRSRTLMERVIRELKLNVEYISQGYLRTKELYKNSPIEIQFLNDTILENTNANYVIKVLNDNEFQFVRDGDVVDKIERFNKWIDIQDKSIRLVRTGNLSEFKDREITIRIRPIQNTVSSYKSRVNIFFPNKTSRVIHLSMVDPNVPKAKDVINDLVRQYNEDALNDKNEISQKTANFISERLDTINIELSSVELQVEQFRKDNNLTDLNAESNIYLEGAKINNQKQLDLETELKLVDYMRDYLSEDELRLIPAKIGLSDGQTQKAISEFNELFLRRKKVLESTGPQNPVVINLTNQLQSLKQSVLRSLDNLEGSLDISLQNLEQQQSQFQGGLSSIPTKERKYRDIQRQQEIKEALFLYLYQKREETNIALEVSVVNAKIIDRAYSTLSPVLPNKRSIYTRALIIGLIIPFIIIFLKNLLDTKIREAKDIEAKFRNPILGEIPKGPAKMQYLVGDHDKSNFAESYRLLDTNLEFLMSDIDTACKSVLITSTLSKEGKTSICLNVALTLAYSGKKVMFLELDLRAPKLSKYLNLKKGIGVSNYVKDNDLNIQDVTFVSNQSENFHYISSGDIPPNPTDILKTKRLRELIHNIKENYDYLIIDSAPVSLVPDALLLSDYADLCAFVLRANYLDKRLLKYPEILIKENRFKNFAFIVNSVTKSKAHGYGYGYGYGYGQEIPLPWYRRILGFKS